MSDQATVPAHEQKVTHRYIVCYEAHEPRADDPHRADFEEYKRRRRENGTYYCDFANDHRNGDSSECDLTKPLECHHDKIELALKNGVDMELLEKDFPGVSKMGIGAWIDSDQNLCLLCVVHHRTYAGVHTISHSDYMGSEYVRGLTKPI